MDTIAVIKARHSIRRYRPVAVPNAVLTDLIDCARLAPTGYNSQPWVFVVVTDPAVRGQIAAIARYGSFIRQAGACIAAFARSDAETYVEDCCAATENIIIAAGAYGLGTCWVNAHRKTHSQAIAKLLGAPADYELVTLLAVGYPDEEKKTAKKPLTDVLRWNHFDGTDANA